MMRTLRPAQVALVERLAVLIGLIVIAVGVAAFDWRVGLIVAGLILIGLAVDLRWPTK